MRSFWSTRALILFLHRGSCVGSHIWPYISTAEVMGDHVIHARARSAFRSGSVYPIWHIGTGVYAFNFIKNINDTQYKRGNKLL